MSKRREFEQTLGTFGPASPTRKRSARYKRIARRWKHNKLAAGWQAWRSAVHLALLRQISSISEEVNEKTDRIKVLSCELIASKKTQVLELDDLRHNITMQHELIQEMAKSRSPVAVAETFVAKVVTEAVAAVALGSVTSAGAELARRTSVWLIRRTFQRVVAGQETRALRKWAEVTRCMRRSKELMSRTIRRHTSGTVSRAVSKWKEALVEGLLLRQQEVI